MPEKNKEYEITIDAYGNSGEGIGRIDGYTLFVPGALLGERVRVLTLKCKKNYGYAKLLEVLSASPERVKPRCPVAHICGGCDLQHMSYDEQIRFKTEHVIDCLVRIGGVDMSDISPELIVRGDHVYGYRNKAQFPVGSDKGGNTVTGFYAPRSHRIIPCDNCYLQDETINEVLRIIMREIGDMDSSLIYDEGTHKGILRHIYIRRAAADGGLMVCLIVKDDKKQIYELADKLTKDKRIKSVLININNNMTNTLLGDRFVSVFGEKYIEDTIGDIRFRISPESFYQVNPYTTKMLYEKALEYADIRGNETVWDLYCGIGTISLFLAKKARSVIGVEVVERAIKNAKENAVLNNINNAEFICGQAEDIISRAMEKGDIKLPDVVVVDPPRKGCDELLIKSIVKASPKRIVYVSCDPATLARDVSRLRSHGYESVKVCVVDQFPQTRHVETVVQLVNIGVKPD